jgi:trimeric autotransporter adhesin
MRSKLLPRVSHVDGLNRISRAARTLALCAFCLCASLYATDIVQTVVGGGSLEGYAASEANLSLEASLGLAIGPTGDVFVSNPGDNQVIKVNPTTGAIQVVAGNGTRSFSGDGGPATGAGLNRPGALVFDTQGNLYIADRGNFVVRRVDALTQVITSVAGQGGVATGDDIGGGQTADFGEGQAAVAATFGRQGTNGPVGIGGLAIDSTGTLFVADQFNHCIRTFTVGGTITTLAGQAGANGNVPNNATPVAAASARFTQPTGLFIDSSGALRIADNNNREIKSLSGGQVALITGNGGGANAFGDDGGDPLGTNIGSLGGLAVDANGNLIFACVGADCVRSTNPSATTPTVVTIAGRGNAVIGDGGPATGATLNAPSDVAIDASGNIFIYDSANQRVRRVDKATGFISTVLGSGLTGFIGDRGPGQNAVLKAPRGAAVGSDGSIYIADTDAHAIRKLAPDGTVSTIAGVGSPDFTGDSGPAYLAALNTPTDVIEIGGSLYIAENGNGLIRKIDLSTGIISTFTSGTNGNPLCLLQDPAGFLLVSNGNNRIQKVDATGAVTNYIGQNAMNTMANPDGDGLPGANATLRGASGMAFGPSGELYIAEANGARVRVISAADVTSTFAGTGTAGFAGDGAAATAAQLNSPYGVALSADNSALFITDQTDNRIRRVTLADGLISTFCGNGTGGFSGDGDVAASAQVNAPMEIFLSGGDLYFVDTNNNRLRRIVSATDLDPKLLAVGVKLAFTVDKKTGLTVQNKDSVQIKAALPLPAGINPANLIIKVDLVDLHQQVQLDASGKQPKAVKSTKTTKDATVFDFTLPEGAPQPSSKFSLGLKTTSVAGAKPTKFSFSSKGTFRNAFARAGLSNETVTKDIPVRAMITVGTTTFTGTATLSYKASQGKSGSAKSLKVK